MPGCCRADGWEWRGSLGGLLSRLNADGASRIQLQRQTILMKHNVNLPLPGAFPMFSDHSRPSLLPLNQESRSLPDVGP